MTSFIQPLVRQTEVEYNSKVQSEEDWRMICSRQAASQNSTFLSAAGLNNLFRSWLAGPPLSVIQRRGIRLQSQSSERPLSSTRPPPPVPAVSQNMNGVPFHINSTPQSNQTQNLETPSFIVCRPSGKKIWMVSLFIRIAHPNARISHKIPQNSTVIWNKHKVSKVGKKTQVKPFWLVFRAGRRAGKLSSANFPRHNGHGVAWGARGQLVGSLLSPLEKNTTTLKWLRDQLTQQIWMSPGCRECCRPVHNKSLLCKRTHRGCAVIYLLLSDQICQQELWTNRPVNLQMLVQQC